MTQPAIDQVGTSGGTTQAKGPLPRPTRRPLKLNAEVIPAPAPYWVTSSDPRPSTFTLLREAELPGLLKVMTSNSEPTDHTASGAAPVRRPSGSAAADGRRPTELATIHEEKRQIMAVCRLVCQATLEALAGARTVQQLQRWFQPEIYQKLRERVSIISRATGVHASHDTTPPAAPRQLDISAMRLCPVTTGVWEVSVVFRQSGRARAAALRLEAHQRRWLITAFELG